MTEFIIPTLTSACADATHIFDGLQAFPTHICHLQLGRTPNPIIHWPIKADGQHAAYKHSHLLEIALNWLKEDRDLRKAREKEQGKKTRGARKGDVSEQTAEDRRLGLISAIIPCRPATLIPFTRSTTIVREKLEAAIFRVLIAQ
jgi:hypothetical protein